MILIMSMMVCGCSARQTVERVCDELLLPAMMPMGQLQIQLPDGALKETMSDETEGAMYLYDNYCVTVQTMEGGDLDGTIRELCGFRKDDLTLMKTELEDLKRYDWIWSCMGEGGCQIGRGAILDDGNYHYCLTVMADEAVAASLDAQWDAIFSSITVAG